MNKAILYVKEIASGAFATTYAAIHDGSTVFAVKDFRNKIETPEAASEILFYQTRQQSPFTLQYLGNTCSTLYLELGVCNLEQFATAYGPLPQPAVGQVFFQLVQCVKYLHNELSLAHRDVKPQNFILSYDGVFKLGDCGCVCAVSNPSNEMVGTQLYRPNKCVKPVALDIYGLGCCLYELATGEQFPRNPDLAALQGCISECAMGLLQNDEEARISFFDGILELPIFSQIDRYRARDISAQQVQLDLQSGERHFDLVISPDLEVRGSAERYEDLLLNEEKIIYEVRTQSSLFKKQRLLLVTDQCRLLGDQIVDLRTAKLFRSRKRELVINQVVYQFESTTDANNFLYFYYFSKYDARPVLQCYCGNKFRIFCQKCRKAASVNGALALLQNTRKEDLPYQARLELLRQSFPHDPLNSRPIRCDIRRTFHNIQVSADPQHKYMTQAPACCSSREISEVSDVETNAPRSLERLDDYLQLSEDSA